MQVYTIRTYDTSSKQKDTENLLQMMEEVLQILKNDWHVIPVGLTSDCGGESGAARRLAIPTSHLRKIQAPAM